MNKSMTISIQSLSDASAELFSKAAASHWGNNNLGNGIPNDAASNVGNLDDLTNTITTSLPEPLTSYFNDFLNSKEYSPANEKVDDFEIATRGHLLSLVQTLLDANESNDIAVIEESIEDILRFFRGVIDITVYIAKSTSIDVNTPQLRKLPFLLMEDVVETIPISLIQIIWKFGPSIWLQSILCQGHLDMFHQGSKYCLIRMCNKLLKNLSVSSQDEAAHFAGEISLILASVFPLSERSAANVLGAFHTDEKYQVEYETQEEWMENSSGGGDHTAGTATGSSSRGKNVALTYGFYSKFWSVQKVFTDPRELVPKSGAQWNQNMERFIMDVQDILGTFDGYKFSKDLMKHLNEKLEAMTRKGICQPSQLNAVASSGSGDVEMEDVNRIPSLSSSATEAKRQYKYLTSSHLLHLQLQDPEIRIHFLSQLLIISSFLSKSLSDLMSTPVGNSIADKVAVEKFQTSLNEMEKNAEGLMRQIPPNGESHLSMLKWILRDRETAWRDWKSKKCLPPIEKFAESVKNSESQSNRPGTNGDNSINTTASTYIYDLDMAKDLPKISREMSQQQSMMSRFFEEYVDALDPEAGIENEYHPKNNKLSCWRALRLLTKTHIGNLAERDGKSMISKKTGDFEGIVRHIWTTEKEIDIPGDMPNAEIISDDEALEDKFESNDAAASGDATASGDQADGVVLEDEDPLNTNSNDVKDVVVEEKKKDTVLTEVDEKIDIVRLPSAENDTNEDDEKEAGEIHEVNEIPRSKDDVSQAHEMNDINEEKVTIDQGAEEPQMESNTETEDKDARHGSALVVDDNATGEKVKNLDNQNGNGTVDEGDKLNNTSLNYKVDDGKRRHREENDQSEKDDHKKRKIDVGSSEVDGYSEQQNIKESDQNEQKKVHESVKVSESVNASSKKTHDSTLPGKHIDTFVVSSTTSTKSVSESKDLKNLQSNGNTDLKADSTVKMAPAARDDGRRSNTKYGTLSGSHSFNNPSGNRRGDNRRQDNLARPSPPPPLPLPPRREHTRESRTGHGTHTRFFSPDGRDEWAMTNRGGRDYGGRAHGDMANRRLNTNDGRGQNRRRERR